MAIHPLRPPRLSICAGLWAALLVSLAGAVLSVQAVAETSPPAGSRQGLPGRDLYVAPDGDDSNPGTEAAPLRTVQRAADLARPGTRILLQDGTYEGGVVFENSGMEGLPVQVLALHHLRAIIRGAAPPRTRSGRGMEIRASNYILAGVRVADASLDGILVVGQRVTIRGCVFEHNGWGVKGERFGGAGILTAGLAHDVRIEKNMCIKNREHGIYIGAGGDRPILIGNLLAENGDPKRAKGGNGLQINADGPGWPTEKAVIVGNVAHGNTAMGFSLQGVVNSFFANNLLYNNRHAVALGLAKGSRGNRFLNNTVVTNGKPRQRALGLLGGGNKGPVTDNKFFNNILVAVGGMPLTFDGPEPSAKTLESDYNLLWVGPGRSVVWNEKKGLKGFSLAQWQREGFDRHSVAADPRFVRPASGDFHLLPGSPALKGGKAFSDVTHDLAGTARPKDRGPTLGAYQGTSRKNE